MTKLHSIVACPSCRTHTRTQWQTHHRVVRSFSPISPNTMHVARAFNFMVDRVSRRVLFILLLFNMYWNIAVDRNGWVRISTATRRASSLARSVTRACSCVGVERMCQRKILITKLYARHIAPHYFRRNFITRAEWMEWRALSERRRNKSRKFPLWNKSTVLIDLFGWNCICVAAEETIMCADNL